MTVRELSEGDSTPEMLSHAEALHSQYGDMAPKDIALSKWSRAKHASQPKQP